jgi:uncharacterized RDD family membrane protein YckC
MACPHCDEVCRCTPQPAAVAGSVSRRARFLPDPEQPLETTASILIDPETTDCSEQQFMASLDRLDWQASRSRFVVDNGDGEENSSVSGGLEAEPSPDSEMQSAERRLSLGCTTEPDPISAVLGERGSDSASESLSIVGTEEILTSHNLSPVNDPCWKDEVSARLSHYRARRKPRPPKYPSLRLKFDPADRGHDSDARPNGVHHRTQSRESVALEAPLPDRTIQEPEPPLDSPPLTSPSLPGESARTIEFPRSYYSPMFPPSSTGEELADPVLDRPRIVEVPETELPEPALGGIILESEEQEPERRPGFEIPLPSARKQRRLLASACDVGIVLGACTLFGYIFFRITGTLPSLATAGSLTGILLIVFWSTYQYLLLTYAGTTPGLRIAHLRLRQFDGSPVDRTLRRWRVLASMLSALSLGLGYAWCFLDEDALCWHDRITHTYLAPTQSDD